ncbi:hypothetical protein MSG28_005891 [Choristoneura fumiferana]|uniref:Uncharacterized protein n=1 Tax=Choristoneura fumiferana TaxID=7141 RepID=A0ACC0L0P9_CHOFU|nr:hypothetical protein MSG28_005891 [Choristoneura fumiferana]
MHFQRESEKPIGKCTFRESKRSEKVVLLNKCAFRESVHFAGLNANDVQRAQGYIQSDDSISGKSFFGMDFSGTTVNGERVMGLVRGGALSDRVAARPELLWPVPEHWSLEDAATVPLPYAHAYYCLAYLTCCSPQGVMLDIDHVERNENFSFGMQHLGFEKSYMVVDLSSIFDNSDGGTLKELQSLISEGISRGVVRPLSRVAYAPHEAPRAFRLLAASRHRGRVLLRLQPTPPLPAQPRIVCSPDNCQIVLCDDVGLTLKLADRLVKRGARTLHLHSTASDSRFSLALKY